MTDALTVQCGYACMPEGGGKVIRCDATITWSRFQPLAVAFAFDQPDGTGVLWEAARDLIIEAIEKPSGGWVGTGDVRVSYGTVSFGMQLRSPEGAATVSMPREPIVTLIRESIHIVTPGGRVEARLVEQCLDRELVGILAGDTAE